MNYTSTRNQNIAFPLSAAIQQGLAMDGGLFVPEHMPVIDYTHFLPENTYAGFAHKLLDVFFKADKLGESLAAICERTFNFPVPLKQINHNTFALELFHGPTSSFKDFGARFLAECLCAIPDCKKTILVATSGDTGSAVASAFYQQENYRVIILYPDGQISAKQEHQITCWGDNIFAFAVNGNFDQCQQLVKSAFTNPDWLSPGLGSANSINIGRLLPQLTWYAYSSLQFYREYACQPGFIIPTGNLGNATAALWAKAMGFPIREIVLATNANRVIPDYLKSGHYQPRVGIATLANAMDVGNPSNMERMNHLFSTFRAIKNNVSAFSVNDDDIKQTIQHIYKHYHYISCPHTATAFHVREQLDNHPWIVVATADPCKFDDVIEPIIHTKIPVAPQLQALLKKTSKIIRVEASLDAIKESICKN